MPDYVPLEKLGTYNGVDFEIHPQTSVGGGKKGCWMYDNSPWFPLHGYESAETFRALLWGKPEVVVFSYDLRRRAREIFHALVTGFDETEPSEQALVVVRKGSHDAA
jgi:hypothetical protein